MVFVYLMNNKKDLNLQVVQEHVEHLRTLDQEGRLVLCGPFADYPGGMVVFRADSEDEALRIAKSDPFIASGFKTFELRTLEVANADNNYLL